MTEAGALLSDPASVLFMWWVRKGQRVGITFGGIVCRDPLPVAQACARQGLPTDWVGRPNSYRCPRGTDYGEAWLLMRKGDLDTLDKDALHELIFEDTEGRQIKFKDLIFHRAKALTPGHIDDPNTPMLVHAADARWLAKNPYYASPISKHYNVWEQQYIVSQLPYSEHYKIFNPTPTGTDNRGDTYKFSTWAEMLANVWKYLNVPELGPSPALPYTPDSFTIQKDTSTLLESYYIAPTSFMFDAMPAADAYAIILRRLGLGLAFDPTKPAKPALVEVGKEDKAFKAAVKKWEGLLWFDAQLVEGTRAKIPEKTSILRIGRNCYSNQPTVGDAGQPGSQFYDPDRGAYLVLTDDTVSGEAISRPEPTEPFWHSSGVDKRSLPDTKTPKGVQPGSRAFIWDDYPALLGPTLGNGNEDPLINEKLRELRAKERARIFYRILNAEPFHRVYGGIIPDPAFLPGSQVGMVSWYDHGQGYRTELASVYEPIPRKDWEHYGTLEAVRYNLIGIDIAALIDQIVGLPPI